MHINAPGPEPLVIFVFAVVGLADVEKHIPLSFTGPPPSSVTSPPVVAVNEVISDTGAVVTVGRDMPMVGVKVRSEP